MAPRYRSQADQAQGYDNPLYAALEVDYSESDQDPTGRAFEQTQKVSSKECHCQVNAGLSIVELDILRA